MKLFKAFTEGTNTEQKDWQMLLKVRDVEYTLADKII